MTTKKENKVVSINPVDFVDDSPLFKFIDPNGNDMMSEMKGYDLQDFLILLDEYYLKLRKKLGFEEYITFGLELEFEYAMKKRIEKGLTASILSYEWVMKDDGSLKKGAEINSPILKDKEADWKDLNKVCSIVEHRAIIGKNSGGHIHIGAQALGGKRDSWLQFIKLWSVYENIIYRFVYGEFLTPRPVMNEYARPMREIFWNIYTEEKENGSSLESILYKLSYERRQAVNFCNVSKENTGKPGKKNTIEFRCPNGTLNSVVWQNNVNLLLRTLLYSKTPEFDDDLIHGRHLTDLPNFDTLRWYNEIHLEQALELCDLVFTNNFDKVYFLRQYLKSFQTSKWLINFQKASPFTKKAS